MNNIDEITFRTFFQLINGKTLTANQNPSCLKELEHVNWQKDIHVKQTKISCIGVDPNIG